MKRLALALQVVVQDRRAALPEFGSNWYYPENRMLPRGKGGRRGHYTVWGVSHQPEASIRLTP